MQVLNFNENNDGSATMEVEMTENEKTFLINFAINRILEEQLEKQIDFEIKKMHEKNKKEE
jgi:uncharacterized membrane protein